MQGISTPQLLILLNGSPHGFFKAHRGLRQGGPLSSHLFILAMNFFSWLIYKAERQNLLKGIKISTGNDNLNHLLFADDLLVLLKASNSSVRACKNLLDKFCSLSGLEVNFEKTGLFFSPRLEVI